MMDEVRLVSQALGFGFALLALAGVIVTACDSYAAWKERENDE